MSYIFIPEKLELNGLYEEDPIKVHLDRVYLIVYKYFQVYLFDKYARQKDGYVYIHSRRFNELSSNYSEIIKWLEKHGIFEVNRSYTPTIHPRKYKVRNEFMTGLRTYKLTDKRTINALVKNINLPHLPTVKKYHSLWKDFSSNGLLFIEEVNSVIEELYEADKKLVSEEEALIKKCIYQLSVFRVRHNHYWFYQDTSGNRLHTNITNLKSDLREKLRFKKENLVEIDIVNSQPYFSIKLLETTYCSIMFPENAESLENSEIDLGNKEELDDYKNKVLDGSIYDYFEEKYIEKYGESAIEEHIQLEYSRKLSWGHKISISGDRGYGKPGYRPKTTGRSSYTPQDLRGLPNRKVVKAMIFNVLYGNLEMKQLNRHKLLFRELFPTIWNLLVYLKKQSETENMAVLLQQLEAKAILDKTVPKIKKHNYRIPLFTIHDCLVTTVTHADFVKETLKAELTALTGYEPKLESDIWN